MKRYGIEVNDLDDGTCDVTVIAFRGTEMVMLAVVNVPGSSDQLGTGIGAQVIPMLPVFGIKVKYTSSGKPEVRVAK